MIYFKFEKDYTTTRDGYPNLGELTEFLTLHQERCCQHMSVCTANYTANKVQMS